MNFTSALCRRLPDDNAQLREALYQGDVFLLPPTAGSRALITAALALLDGAFGAEPRAVHERLDAAQIFSKVGAMRRRVYLERPFHNLLRTLISELSFEPSSVAFDPARLRAILIDGHKNAAAKAAYFAHRDIWYANPPATITCWLPLHDLQDNETFTLYPDCFAKPVPNDSRAFDYRAWVGHDWSRKIGWQKADSSLTAHYPGSADAAVGVPEPAYGRELRFSCRAGEILLFSAAHLHRTIPLSGKLARFSLDFRLAHIMDVAARRGAPNVDNASRGNCFADYIHPGQAWPPIPLRQ